MQTAFVLDTKMQYELEHELLSWSPPMSFLSGSLDFKICRYQARLFISLLFAIFMYVFRDWIVFDRGDFAWNITLSLRGAEFGYGPRRSIHRIH